MYLQAQAHFGQVVQGDERALEALLLHLLLCPPPLTLLIATDATDTTGHPEDLVLPARQTSENLLTQIGEEVLVSPREVAGLQMLLIPETIDSKYYDTITNQKDKERHVRGKRTVVSTEQCPEVGQYQDEIR